MLHPPRPHKGTRDIILYRSSLFRELSVREKLKKKKLEISPLTTSHTGASRPFIRKTSTEVYLSSGKRFGSVVAVQLSLQRRDSMINDQRYFRSSGTYPQPTVSSRNQQHNSVLGQLGMLRMFCNNNAFFARKQKKRNFTQNDRSYCWTPTNVSTNYI